MEDRILLSDAPEKPESVDAAEDDAASPKKGLMNLISESMKEFLQYFSMRLQNGNGNHHALTAEAFKVVLERERARSDRDGKSFCLVIFNSIEHTASKDPLKIYIGFIRDRVRITDVLWWTEDGNIGLFLYNTKAAGAFSVIRRLQKSSDRTLPFHYDIFQYPDTRKPWKGGDGAPPPGAPDRKGTSMDPMHGMHDSVVLNSPDALSCSETGALELKGNSPLIIYMPLWKRLIDILGSTIGIVLLAPLFLMIAACIKICSPGPVFFIQERIGRGGRRFMCWKFRTMTVSADSGIHRQHLVHLIDSAAVSDSSAEPMEKLAHDSRIIPVIGRILRASCLDEIPQLINVWLGEMSLIGPRPAIPYEVEAYRQWYFERFDAWPGMTGLWQVSGKNRLTFNQMMRLDISYARTLSPAHDLAILLSTPRAILDQILDILHQDISPVQQFS